MVQTLEEMQNALSLLYKRWWAEAKQNGFDAKSFKKAIIGSE